jgi:multiple sugar transport system permease protein
MSMTQLQAVQPALKGTRSIGRIFFQRTLKALPALIFLGPAVVAFLLFRYYPLAQGLYMSLFRWDTVHPPGEFVGLNNMSLAINSSVFHEAFVNTLMLYAFGMLLGFWVPIVQSLFLSELRRGHYFVRFLYVLPVAVPGIAFLIVWKYIWHPEFGLANAVLQVFSLPKQFWLSDPNLVKVTLRLPSLLGGGLGILIYLAAIQNISPEIIEAAIMDGANAWQRTWRIIVPNITSIIGIMFVLSLTGSLLAFDDVWIMTAGGPGYSSTTLVMGVYQQAFVQNQYGTGSAWALWIFIFTLLFTMVRLYTMREEKA